MTSRIRAEMATFVRTTRDQCFATERPSRSVALDAVRALPDGPLLRRLAAEFVVDAIARIEREAALVAERNAETPAVAHESLSPAPTRRISPPRRGTVAYRQWVESTDEGREHEALQQQWDAEDETRERQLVSDVFDAMRTYESALRMQWTEELLTTTFALPDGTLVTWGTATVEQHKMRRDMFLQNAQANVEGAARHDQAIHDLSDAGAPTLADLMRSAA